MTKVMTWIKSSPYQWHSEQLKGLEKRLVNYGATPLIVILLGLTSYWAHLDLSNLFIPSWVQGSVPSCALFAVAVVGFIVGIRHADRVNKEQ